MTGYEPAVTPLLPDGRAIVPFAAAADPCSAGYVYLPSLLAPRVIDPVRAVVRQYGEAAGWIATEPGNPACFRAAPGARIGCAWEDPQWVGLQRMLCESPEFRELAAAPPLLAALERIFGEPPVHALANFCWLRLPGDPAQTTGPHQDSFYLPDSPAVWTVWIPIVDTPMDLGPLAVVPGSHREGRRPHRHAFSGVEVGDNETWATGLFAPGDVLAFGPHTIHCAWSNMTADLVRAAFDIRYEPRSLVTLNPLHSPGATPGGSPTRRKAPGSRSRRPPARRAHKGERK